MPSKSHLVFNGKKLMITSAYDELFFTQTKVTAFIAALVLVSLLEYIDLMASPAMALSSFYLIPIFQRTWFVGKQAGLFTAFVSALAFYFANSSIWIPDKI